MSMTPAQKTKAKEIFKELRKELHTISQKHRQHVGTILTQLDAKKIDAIKQRIQGM